MRSKSSSTDEALFFTGIGGQQNVIEGEGVVIKNRHELGHGEVNKFEECGTEERFEKPAFAISKTVHVYSMRDLKNFGVNDTKDRRKHARKDKNSGAAFAQAHYTIE